MSRAIEKDVLMILSGGYMPTAPRPRRRRRCKRKRRAIELLDDIVEQQEPLLPPNFEVVADSHSQEAISKLIANQSSDSEFEQRYDGVHLPSNPCGW